MWAWVGGVMPLRNHFAYIYVEFITHSSISPFVEIFCNSLAICVRISDFVRKQCVICCVSRRKAYPKLMVFLCISAQEPNHNHRFVCMQRSIKQKLVNGNFDGTNGKYLRCRSERHDYSICDTKRASCMLAKIGDTFNCENLPTIRVKSRSTHFYILRNDRYLHSQWQLISNTKVHFWVDPIATSLTRSLNFVTRRDQHADNFE